MPEPVCPLCKGLSWTETRIGDEIVPFRCACFKRRLALSFLGPELAKAPFLRSALYCPEIDAETNEVVGDRTLDDLFIKGTWGEVAQHLRWAVGAKHFDRPEFTFKMVTDEMLLRVYLGHYAYTHRSRNVRDTIETYNTLGDLIGDCGLLIVRLGNLAHPNKAAGNVLLEALRIRASASKATWLIEGSTFFGEGHGFYNYEVATFIEENFETINVGGDVEVERRMEAELKALNASSYAADAKGSEHAAATETKERFVAEPGAWARGHKKSRWGKRRDGGLIEL